jgi:putative molybdopterin biosynthesis protein
VAIETVAKSYGLGFIALQPEHYDFVIPAARRERAAVRRFVALLASEAVQAELRGLGFDVG